MVLTSHERRIILKPSNSLVSSLLLGAYVLSGLIDGDDDFSMILFRTALVSLSDDLFFNNRELAAFSIFSYLLILNEFLGVLSGVHIVVLKYDDSLSLLKSSNLLNETFGRPWITILPNPYYSCLVILVFSMFAKSKPTLTLFLATALLRGVVPETF